MRRGRGRHAPVRKHMRRMFGAPDQDTPSFAACTGDPMACDGACPRHAPARYVAQARHYGVFQ